MAMFPRFPIFQSDKRAVIPALFLTSSLLLWLFGEPTFPLDDLTALYISQATKKGVDVPARVNYFYQILLAGALVLPLLYFAYSWLCRQFRWNSKELDIIQLTAFTGICLILTDIIGIDCGTVILLFFIVVMIMIAYCLLITCSRSPRNMHSFFFRLYPLFLMTSMTAVATISFLFNSAGLSAWSSILILTVLPLLISAAILLIKNHLGVPTRQLTTAFIPLALIPLFLFFSIELLIYGKETYDIFLPWKWIFVAITGSTFFLFLPFVIKRMVVLSTKKVLQFFFLPAGLLGFVLCTQYTPIIDQPTAMFELANPANAQMRLFKFGEWPLVDFMSSHLFFDQFYGIIYHAIFGYNGDLDFLTYEFLKQLLLYTALLYFLINLFGSGPLALLMAVTFPFLWFFFSKPVFLSVLAFFMIRKLVIKQAWHHYFLLFLVLAALVLWRIDTGVAALFATLFFLPISYYTERKPVNWSSFLKGSVAFLILVALLMCPFIILKGADHLLTSFLNMYHYIAASQGHGYSSIAYEHPQQFYLYYVAFPAIALLIVFHIVHTLRNKVHYQDSFGSFSLNAALFFFFVYFGNFQRGLVRHSFIENTDVFVASTFFLALTLTIIPHLPPQRPAWRYIYFFGFGFALVLLLKYHPLDKGPSHMERFLANPSIAGIDNEFTNQHYEGRVRTNNQFAKKNYKDLKAFLDRNLTDDQTFLDFSNTPMLYFYCQRSMPSYFCQNLQNSIDDYLQKKHIEAVKSSSDVPVVIYSHYPPNWWDKTDNVPNAMRYYFITAFIHKNYEPYGVIDNRRIWVKNGWRPKGQFEKQDTLSYEPKSYYYEKSAGFLASYFMNEANKRLDQVAQLKPKKEGEGQYRAALSQKATSYPTALAHVKCKNTKPGQRIMFKLMDEEESLGNSSFVTSKEKEDYIIPLFVHYTWQYADVTNLKLTAKEGFRVKELTLYRDKGYEP